MIDVRELERRWIRYKMRKYLPYLILIVSVLFVFIMIIKIDFSKKEQTPTKVAQNKVQSIASVTHKQPDTPTAAKLSPSSVSKQPATQPKIQPSQQALPASEPVIKPTVPQHNQDTPIQVLKPSLDFLRKMKDNSVVPQSEPLVTQEQLNTTSNASSKQTNIKIQQQHISSDKTQEATKTKIEIKIKKTSKKDLQAIIARFKKSNNPILGVFIAKKYYEMGDYHKAYNYALITNQIDSSIEDSWIIFAKSLVKLGQKKRAIETLDAYIKTSNSSRAQILLENIKTGKFR